MKDASYLIYTLTSLALFAVDFHFAVKAFRKGDKVGRALGWSAACAGIITLSYLGSVHFKKQVLASVFSSLTFISIDCMIISVLYYAVLVTGSYKKRWIGTLNSALRIVATLDIFSLFLNIFTGLAVDIITLEPVGVRYGMKPLYIAHLAFTYLLVAITLALLIHKSVKTPREYRNQYILIIAAIGVVVAVNAAYLFLDKNSFLTKVDCSFFGYSLGLYLMYWTAYEYKENDMVNVLARMAMNNVNQGIVLFDYLDELIVFNRRARELLRGVGLEGGLPAREFQEACGIAPRSDDLFSTQCDIEDCMPLRCDFRRLRDKRGAVIGSLYTFTDISRDTDITTGFEYAKDYRYIGEHPELSVNPTTIAVFDVVGLKEVNRVQGRDAGDVMIRALAKTMRENMPPDVTFLRGYEANLIAICPNARERDLADEVARIANADEKVMCGLCECDGTNLHQALEIAYRSIHIKKLLSPKSVHSQALTSLVRALKEADADTEDHVRRTQKMGAMLGRRIGLTDAQMAQLELLCLLHDIGKIGVPLEILNKPGKLSEQEWQVLKGHPEKGFQIAMSTDELKSIAEMILGHHERWDGRGYPRMLKGEEIPILSRIIAIVDSYDAMVNDRVYRKALAPEAAQEEIRRCAGAQFDPGLAEQFLQMLRENPELAFGEKVGAASQEGIVGTLAMEDEENGHTIPVAYSRYMLNAAETIIAVDRNFEEITGFCAEEVVGKMSQYDLVPKEDRASYICHVNRQFKHGDMVYLRHEILRKDGDRCQVACCGRRYFDAAAKDYRNEIVVFRL